MPTLVRVWQGIATLPNDPYTLNFGLEPTLTADTLIDDVLKDAWSSVGHVIGRVRIPAGTPFQLKGIMDPNFPTTLAPLIGFVAGWRLGAMFPKNGLLIRQGERQAVVGDPAFILKALKRETKGLQSLSGNHETLHAVAEIVLQRFQDHRQFGLPEVLRALPPETQIATAMGHCLGFLYPSMPIAVMENWGRSPIDF